MDAAAKRTFSVAASNGSFAALLEAQGQKRGEGASLTDSPLAGANGPCRLEWPLTGSTIR
jgi:hypothetical protein